MKQSLVFLSEKNLYLCHIIIKEQSQFTDKVNNIG